ncbi:acyl-CoA-binding domain-containing protein 3 isoform X2 [Solanum dulcamara]|uniref:acyl-CoA-binding domain-containing protein 3 isoform X2 n=1 Tax=Solanum dulcamara TaxID=45834 RepID=UPI002486051F|nr:acyl-CoA-binding domain-containing protein 3 isoform X2 [Solanum dulcamara]
MNFFQEFFVTAMVALIFSCIIVKLISAAVSNNGRFDKEKIVVEEVKISKGLVVRSRKSKKRVKFVEQEVVGNVDRVETQIPNKDGVEGFVEEKINGVLKKGEDFNGEKISENLDLIEHFGGEREVKIGLLEEKDEAKKIEEKIEGVLKKGDDFKGEKVCENLDLIEHCGAERGMSDGHDDADVCSKIGLLEEKDEVEKIEKKIEGKLKKDDYFKGEKVPENLELIEHCGGEKEVSDGHDDADMCNKIELMEEKVEIKKIDELLVVKEKVIANALVVDEIKVGENEVVEIGGGLSKGDDEKTDKMAMDVDSDDDWEGIERSELEEEFVKAVNFVDGGNGKNSGMENLGSELMMQLYGLQKIAMEGPCHEPQPMALKVYARAKWNAWQKMGSMSQEVAMEQYIKLLSDHVPNWTHHSKDDCEVGSSQTKMPGEPDSLNEISKDVSFCIYLQDTGNEPCCRGR